MPKVSINILTRNRIDFLEQALASIENQSFKDVEIIIVDDASTDATQEFVKHLPQGLYRIIRQPLQKGITFNRQAALSMSSGDYIAILDDDDKWQGVNKLKKQVEFLDANPGVVLVGGGMQIMDGQIKLRPENDRLIRKTMLLRNNFFTSTVMFRRKFAIQAGGFIKDTIDLGEDYDLWLRMGKLGKMYNFQEAFVNYSKPSYNKEKFLKFLHKQLLLIEREKKAYPLYFFARFVLKIRLKLYDFFF